MDKLIVTKSKAKHIGECNFCGAGTDPNGSLSATHTIYVITGSRSGFQIRCCGDCLQALKKIRLMRTVKE